MSPGSRSRRAIYYLLLGYSVVIAVSYVLPKWPEVEWYGFYKYLDEHGAVPYVDVREGYPPLGFLSYMPLYFVFRDNPAAFSHGFRALNGAFLILTLYTLYLIFRSKFEEREALKHTLYYAALPSVMIVNSYSNDVVALLPAVLAIYFMTKKRAVLCGTFIGMATLGKGFPILLIIPSLRAFTDIRDRIKIIGVTLITLVIFSLPFMLVSPLTYVSTFTHIASRGPWETIWALIEGYRSHGGFLHPLFDKFFYHDNLLMIYPANPFDHAIYEWRFDYLPALLTIGQIMAIFTLSVVYLKRKDDMLSLCGLLYVSYMLFFKGYSTQFSVSTQLFTLLAASYKPLLFLVPLELSHLLQIISYWSFQDVAPELLRNEHLLLLVGAIMLRTVVFSSMFLRASMSFRRDFRQLSLSAKNLVIYLRLVSDRRVISLLSAMLMASLIGYALVSSNYEGSFFRSFGGSIEVTMEDSEILEMGDLRRGDQVMVRLETSTWIDAVVDTGNGLVQAERGIRNPYHLKGSFNETMLFFTVGSEFDGLSLEMLHPKIPFRVTDGLEGDLRVNITLEGSALLLRLSDDGQDGRDSRFRIAYPCGVSVRSDFSIGLRYRLVEGEVTRVDLDVFDDTDEWLYSFEAPEDFVLGPGTRDMYGYSNLFNDDISLIAVGISLDDGQSACVMLEELSIRGGGDARSIEFYAEDSEDVRYTVFIERDPEPSALYMAAMLMSVGFGMAAIYLIYRNACRLSWDRRV